MHNAVPSFFATYSPDGTEVIRAGDASLIGHEPFIDLADAVDGRWVEDLGDSGGEGNAVWDRLWPRPRSARFAEGGESAVLTGDGGAVVLDATSEYEVLAVQDDHEGAVWDAELSPEGDEVATTGADGVIRIWDAETGITRLVLPGGGATDLAYSPDGHRLAATGPNGATTVYILDVDELIATARARLTRTWTVRECEQYRLGETCMSLATAARAETPGGEAEEPPADEPAEPSGGADAEPVGEPDVEPVDEAIALSLGEDFVVAMDAHDLEAARRVVADDATFDVFWADWGTDVALLFEWLVAGDWRFDPVGCKQTGHDTVRCTVDQRTAWSEALDVPPTPGAVTLTLDQDVIRNVRYEFSLQEEAFRPFGGFVRENDPDAFEAMWITDGLFRPAATQESVELFERYTAAFVASLAS